MENDGSEVYTLFHKKANVSSLFLSYALRYYILFLIDGWGGSQNKGLKNGRWKNCALQNKQKSQK